MARLPRFCPAGLPQHVIQRGNNRSACFIDSQDYAVYANWLTEYAENHAVAIHAWVFMTNHVHLLLTPGHDGGVSGLMQSLGRAYVRYFNRAHGRSGTLWEGRFRSSPVQAVDYLLACYRYIELNPVRAGMVQFPEQYRWSSYHCNALGVISPLCTPHPEYLNLAGSYEQRFSVYRALVDAGLDGEWLQDIRDSLNKGLALGSEAFKDEVELLYGRRQRAARIGRPRKSVAVRSARKVLSDPTFSGE